MVVLRLKHFVSASNEEIAVKSMSRRKFVAAARCRYGYAKMRWHEKGV